MRCNRVDHLMPAYLEDSLAPGLTAQVADHLERCSRCRDQEAAHHQAMRLLDQGRHSPSIDLWADFSRRLQQEAPPRRPVWQYLWQPGLASALAAIVVALVARTAPVPSPDFQRFTDRTSVQSAATHLDAAPAETTRGQIDAGRRQTEVRPPRADQVAVARRDSDRQEQRADPGRRPQPRQAVRLARATIAGELLRARPTPVRAQATREQPPAMVQVARATVDDAGATAPPWRTATEEPARAAADPLDVAEALVEAQQDAASDRVRGQLLLLAREVARVGGEVPASDDAAHAAGT